jgi:hypothetical protein
LGFRQEDRRGLTVTGRVPLRATGWAPAAEVDRRTAGKYYWYVYLWSSCDSKKLVTAVVAVTVVQGCALMLSLDEFSNADPARPDGGEVLDGGEVGGNCPLDVYPESHEFGPVVIGGVSSPIRFTVVGQEDDPVGPVRLYGGEVPNVNFVIVEETCEGATLGRGETCTVDVVFSPKEAGSHTAFLFVLVGEGGCASSFYRGEGRTVDPPDAPVDAGPDAPKEAGSPPVGPVVLDPPLISDTEIGLTWKPVERATEYAVLWSTVQGGWITSVSTTWAVITTDTSVETWISVHPCNSYGCGAPANLGPIKK